MSQPALHHYLLPGLPVVACEYPHHPEDSASAIAKRAVLADLGVTHVLDLTEPRDSLAPYPLDAGSAYAAWRPQHVRFPIRDGSVPSDLVAFDAVVEHLAALVTRGEVVAVHCWGGIGRTGTVAAALLVRYGWPLEAALAEINCLWQTLPKARRTAHLGRTAPENDAQRAFVRDWSHRHAAARPPLPAPRGLNARAARACLLGGALGDALGASVEFMTLPEIRARHGAAGITHPHPAYGVDCPLTDDTQMTLFTAEGLLRAAQHADAVLTRIGDAYVRWLFTQEPSWVPPAHAALAAPRGLLLDTPAMQSRRAPGNTCLSALRAYARASAPRRVADNQSKGCGTVMRVAPIGLVASSPAEAYALAADASALTHGHSTGIMAGGVFAAIVQGLRDGASLEQAVRDARDCVPDGAESRETLVALDAAVTLGQTRGAAMTPDDLYTLGEGWVAEEALAIAVACAFAHPANFVAATCLAANLVRGDSDSTASMAGQLVGLMVGPEGLPADWLARLELRALIETVADDLATGWRAGARWAAAWPAH
jgi:ADP-ribosylglycohydrolase